MQAYAQDYSALHIPLMKTSKRLLGVIFRYLGKPRGLERVVLKVMPDSSFAPSDEITISLQGQRVRLWPRSRIGWNLFAFGDYEPELRALFRRYVPEGGVVVEVGANIGWHLLLFCKLVGSSGKVHAFEPNRSVYAEMCGNLTLNQVKNATTWNCALSTESGNAIFQGVAVNERGAGNGHLVLADSVQDTGPAAGGKEVRVESLDGLNLPLTRLDLMKIDVEGAENEVLTGAIRTIERFLPVLVFEHLEDFNGRSNGNHAGVVSRLSGLGYQFHAICSRGGTRPLAAVTGYSGDVLALPPGNSPPLG
jgi:FkbM family methyltransferase